MIPEERLRRAAKEANEIHLACLPDEDEIEYEPSPTFKKKMKRLIKRIDHPVLYYSQKVAGFLLVFLVSASLWLTLDTNSRAIFFDWIEEQYEHYQHYFFTDDSAQVLPEDAEYRLGWVPDGYTENEVFEKGTEVTVVYTNREERIIKLLYQRDTTKENLFLDLTDMMHHVVEIKGDSADYYESKNSEIASVLVYYDNDANMLFCLSGFVAEDEFVKMAENITLEPTDITN